jgi:hypothetical protein
LPAQASGCKAATSGGGIGRGEIDRSAENSLECWVRVKKKRTDAKIYRRTDDDHCAGGRHDLVVAIHYDPAGFAWADLAEHRVPEWAIGAPRV